MWWPGPPRPARALAHTVRGLDGLQVVEDVGADGGVDGVSIVKVVWLGHVCITQRLILRAIAVAAFTVDALQRLLPVGPEL